MNPKVLNEAGSIAVCIEPVGGNAFINSELNSLKTIGDIDKIFVHPSDHPEHHKRAWVKYKSALRETFKCSKPCDPDISCTVAGGKLSLRYVKGILIDPYMVSGKPLRDWVQGYFLPKRTTFSEREPLYGSISIMS